MLELNRKRGNSEKGGENVGERYSSIDDLVREVEDSGYDTSKVVVDKSAILYPREETEEEN